MAIQRLSPFRRNVIDTGVAERRKGKKGVLKVSALMLMAFNVVVLMRRKEKRHLSISLTDGDCVWTDAEALDENILDPYGTLFASYPASGMRVTWQQAEGASGIKVRDDFFQVQYPKQGLVKTQYPHYEGIWSYGQNMNQVIYVLRNPRWALPSYLTILSELHYAHTWEIAYDHLPEVFTKRAPLEEWIKWRDYRFEDELRIWGLHIDFYMEDGAQYWIPFDFERNGQWPFHFYNDSEKPWPRDYHCEFDIDSCVPVAIISYERLRHPDYGAGELHKIANSIRGKEGMTVLDPENIDCIWHDTWINTLAPYNDARDKNGLLRTAYNFTIEQMYKIEDKLIEYETKYSTEEWVNNTQAQDLVWNFQAYLEEVREERIRMEDDPPPTQAPNANYTNELTAWYNSKGKGNRYSKAKIQTMGIWELVKHFYD